MVFRYRRWSIVTCRRRASALYFEKALDTHLEPTLRRGGCTQPSSFFAANLRRSRQHTLLFPIDRDSLYNRSTNQPIDSHLLSALLYPQEFRSDMAQYLAAPLLFVYRSIITVRWTVFTRSTSIDARIPCGTFSAHYVYIHETKIAHTVPQIKYNIVNYK